jgi:hypothetical protein
MKPICQLCHKNPADHFAATYCHQCFFSHFKDEQKEMKWLIPQDHVWLKLREERVAWFTARAELSLPLFEEVPDYLYVLPRETENALMAKSAGYGLQLNRQLEPRERRRRVRLIR